MKVIYDLDQPAHKRCVIKNDDGSETLCGAYWIQIETTVNGQAGIALSFKRWGTIKERQGRHEAVAKTLTEQQG